MRMFKFKAPNKFIKAYLAIALVAALAIPTIANAQIRVGSTSGSTGDWVYYQDYDTPSQSDDTPIIQNVCVLQYQIHNGSQYKALVDRSMARIGAAVGVPVQYMGMTNAVPQHADRNPVLTFTFQSHALSGGHAAVASPFAVFRNPNADPQKAESYRDFILRGGVVAFNTSLVPAHLMENTILHEGTHLVGLGDRYNDDSMMGTRYFTPGSDYSAYDYNLLRTAGKESRDPQKCWMSPTADKSLRPDVTSGQPPTPTVPPTTPTVPPTTPTIPPTTPTVPPTSPTVPPTTPTTPPVILKDGMTIKTTYSSVPKKIGDKVTFTFKVTNTGTSRLSQIKLSVPSLNKPGTSSFATIPGLFAGWSQTITAVYTWDGKNFFGPQNKLTATATPLNVDNSSRPTIKYPAGL
jgi:hypothetical protein